MRLTVAPTHLVVKGHWSLCSTQTLSLRMALTCETPTFHYDQWAETDETRRRRANALGSPAASHGENSARFEHFSPPVGLSDIGAPVDEVDTVSENHRRPGDATRNRSRAAWGASRRWSTGDRSLPGTGCGALPLVDGVGPVPVLSISHVGTVDPGVRTRPFDLLRPFADVVAQRGQFALALIGFEAHRTDHADATGIADRGEHVAAKVERARAGSGSRGGHRSGPLGPR